MKAIVKHQPTCNTQGLLRLFSRNKNPGRRIIGGRVYDSELGITCHWCRQKTVDDHVLCSICVSAFCGACLKNRHGESIRLEMPESVKWVCPKCRGGCGQGCQNCCNCGPCRKSQGLEPTGMIIHIVRVMGFTNAHDYLIHVRTGESPQEIWKRKIGRGWCATENLNDMDCDSGFRLDNCRFEDLRVWTGMKQLRKRDIVVSKGNNHTLANKFGEIRQLSECTMMKEVFVGNGKANPGSLTCNMEEDEKHIVQNGHFLNGLGIGLYTITFNGSSRSDTIIPPLASSSSQGAAKNSGELCTSDLLPASVLTVSKGLVEKSKDKVDFSERESLFDKTSVDLDTITCDGSSRRDTSIPPLGSSSSQDAAEKSGEFCTSDLLPVSALTVLKGLVEKSKDKADFSEAESLFDKSKPSTLPPITFVFKRRRKGIQAKKAKLGDRKNPPSPRFGERLLSSIKVENIPETDNVTASNQGHKSLSGQEVIYISDDDHKVNKKSPSVKVERGFEMDSVTETQRKEEPGCREGILFIEDSKDDNESTPLAPTKIVVESKPRETIYIDGEDEIPQEKTPKMHTAKKPRLCGLPSGLCSAEKFKEELGKRLDEPFSLQQLHFMWKCIAEKKPLYKARETRHGVFDYPTGRRGLSYLDHFPELLHGLSLANHPKEKLKLLRGFFFWLENAGTPGAFKPWVASNLHHSDNADCMETQGPDCQVLAVVQPVDEQSTVSHIPTWSRSFEKCERKDIKRENLPPFSLFKQCPRDKGEINVTCYQPKLQDLVPKYRDGEEMKPSHLRQVCIKLDEKKGQLEETPVHCQDPYAISNGHLTFHNC